MVEWDDQFLSPPWLGSRPKASTILGCVSLGTGANPLPSVLKSDGLPPELINQTKSNQVKLKPNGEKT